MLIKKWLRKDKKTLSSTRGITLGKGCRVKGTPIATIVAGAQIVIGKKVVINSEPHGYHAGMSFPVTLSADRDGAQITIGNESRLHGCCLHAWSSISVGEKCLLAAGSQVLDSNGHAVDLKYAKLRTITQDNPEPIVIEDYCWIGLGAVILKGVHLGKGCIIGANAVVTKGKYPPFSLIIGNPAKVVKTLHPDDVLPENYPEDLLKNEGVSINKY